MEIQSSNESLQQISPSEGSSSAHNINGKGDGSQQEISPNSKDRDLQSQQSDPTSGGPKLLRKRGRPPGRSKRASTSGTIGYLPPVASDFQHDITNMADWKTLPKEQILKKLEALPPGMELYDLVRFPRVLKENMNEILNRTTLLSSTGLTEDLSCPICMGTYNNVAVVKDCLHRFCEECIERWLRTGHQDCPKCRNRIPSRRSLRADPIFERIVRRLFPDVENFERMNDRAVAAINERRTGLSEAVFYREDSAGKVRARSHRRSQRSTWKQTGTSSSANNCPSRLATVKVVLVPDPNQPELKKLAKVNLAPLRIISIHQLKMMISVSGSLGGGTPLDLRTSKDGPPLGPEEKVKDLMLSSNSSTITLHVSLTSPKLGEQDQKEHLEISPFIADSAKPGAQQREGD